MWHVLKLVGWLKRGQQLFDPHKRLGIISLKPIIYVFLNFSLRYKYNKGLVPKTMLNVLYQYYSEVLAFVTLEYLYH